MSEKCKYCGELVVRDYMCEWCVDNEDRIKRDPSIIKIRQGSLEVLRNHDL